MALGRFEDAESPLRELLLARQTTGQNWELAEVQSILGHCLRHLERNDEALPLLSQGYDTLLSARGPDDRRTREALQRLVGYYEAAGQTELAASFRARLAPEPTAPPPQ
jgi:hypothetical protein